MSNENSGDLEFAALHADDLLLDALGARRPAGSADDPVAGLLMAYATELDTRPGPLTALLNPDHVGAVLLSPVPEYAPAPPIELPSARRARFLLAPRAAAIVTVGAIVLGVGGVSAAVTGEGGPLQGIRRVVDSVTEQVTPRRDNAERVAQLLDSAKKALAADDLRGARTYLEQARTELSSVADPTALGALRSDLILLRDRWHTAFERGAEKAAAAKQEAAKKDRTAERPTVPGNGNILVPETETAPEDLVPGTGVVDPTENVPVFGDDGRLAQTKEEIADKASEKLDPLPDLPFDQVRAPTWAPIIGGR